MFGDDCTFFLRDVCKIYTFSFEKFFSDASLRKYARIRIPSGCTYILVFYPRIEKKSFFSFLRVALLFSKLEFRVPHIFYHDHSLGYMLIEDFGDNVYLDYLNKNQSEVFKLYKNAVDVLIKLHKVNIKEYKSVIPFRKKLLSAFYEEIFVVFKWYLKLKNITIDSNYNAINVLYNEFIKTKNILKGESGVMTIFDYHSPNLIYLENETGIDSVGIIDFQDMKIFNRFYDLVSLLHDARFSIDLDISNDLFDYYCSYFKNDIDRKKAQKTFYAISLQRNMRILGVFARQNILYNNTNYMKNIFRVESYIQISLDKIVEFSTISKVFEKLSIF